MAALFQRHARMLLAYIRPRVDAKEEAEDLLVEVFLAALQQETPWHLSEREQLTWLRRVARNKIIDRFRRLGRLPALTSLEGLAEVLLDDEECLPEALALRNADYAELRRHLASLSQMQQEILRLRFANGLSTREIAARLAKSDGTIRVLLSRALNRLRALYEQPQEGETTHG